MDRRIDLKHKHPFSVLTYKISDEGTLPVFVKMSTQPQRHSVV